MTSLNCTTPSLNVARYRHRIEDMRWLHPEKTTRKPMCIRPTTEHKIATNYNAQCWWRSGQSVISMSFQTVTYHKKKQDPKYRSHYSIVQAFPLQKPVGVWHCWHGPQNLHMLNTKSQTIIPIKLLISNFHSAVRSNSFCVPHELTTYSSNSVSHWLQAQQSTTKITATTAAGRTITTTTITATTITTTTTLLILDDFSCGSAINPPGKRQALNPEF